MKTTKEQVGCFAQKYYFDTCSINILADKLSSITDCLATRKLINERKKQWIISPLNLYELLGISDPIRRDEVLYKTSNFFPKPGMIFDTPTRILFNRIISYNPEKSTNLEESVRKVWFNAVNQGTRFEFDFDDLKKRTKILENFTKAMKFVLHNNTCIADQNSGLPDEVLSILAHLTIFQPTLDVVDRKEEGKFYIKLILILAIFCFGVEPDHEFIDQFWITQKINKYEESVVLGRFYHISTKYHNALFESPEIELMTGYIVSEYKIKGTNRGTLKDALHLLYTFHCGFFVTDDSSFLEYSQENDFLRERIFSVRENFTAQGEYSVQY